MMGETISISLVISIISIVIVIWTFAKNSKKDTKTEAEQESAKMDSIKESLLKANMKLDQVCATTNETRSDIKGMNAIINDLQIEIAVLQRDLKTAFTRIEELEEKCRGDETK